MQIIGNTDKGYLISATEDELAIATGHTNTYSEGWRKLKRAIPVSDAARLPIGTVLNVQGVFRYNASIAAHADKARECSSTLRALADLIDRTTPDAVIPPEPAGEVEGI
jgi:hypothetical protein